ncbi:H-NS family nucleoid-associated regulatory protein [Pantoea vagans]|uniref:H-NS family histone-like protein n=1 Tax=Pantoea vagans TaxID=470934 RepID=UPI0023B1A40B|nr:H-NS family nucleoid-associated regulatory protein [Pantoea vagans]MDE8558850.1 H-NS family nucleoid-associated regulatory protein [Pantoea vagans]MDE8578855.1 H-NS family nucleoid-associated regulatory protein [Pantoea vagans]
MSESLKNLNNIRTLRAQARETSLELLEDMLAKLSTVVEEHREEQASVRKVQEEKQAKLKAIHAQLLEDGIDPQELLKGLSPNQKIRSTREARPAKYKYTDEQGNQRTWTGQGRTPKAIAIAIANGKQLKDFTI